MRKRVIGRRTLRLAVLVSLCIAATATAARGVDWVLLVDNTGTMRYASRGAMTIEAIGEFVAQAERGDRISVVSYGERTALALANCPVILGSESSRDRVLAGIELSFSADRTDITAGLEYVWNERSRLFPCLESGDGERSDAIVVLLTDGKLIPVYDSYAHYESTYSKSRKRLLELASLCGEQGIRICTIGLGRKEKVDGELMEAVAARTGGTYRHVGTSSDVVEAYRGIAAEYREPEPVSYVEHQAPRKGLRIQDAASAHESSGQRPGNGGGSPHADAHTSGGMTAFPSDFCLGSAGIIAIFIGMIAVGTEKHQKWAGRFFSANLFGTGEKRVRGYLKPVDSPGMCSARANIGLENPGLASLRIGNGTSFIPQVEVTLEFCGTTDGSPPELRVENGSVNVDGEATTTRKLKDGDVIEVDGLLYQYLRGNRR